MNNEGVKFSYIWAVEAVLEARELAKFARPGQTEDSVVSDAIARMRPSRHEMRSAVYVTMPEPGTFACNGFRTWRVIFGGLVRSTSAEEAGCEVNHVLERQPLPRLTLPGGVQLHIHQLTTNDRESCTIG